MNRHIRLVDILVEHLENRGGWPPGVAAMTQSAIDGEIYMHKKSDGELTARGVYFLQVAEDCRKPVKREDYEKHASISSRKKTGMKAIRDSYAKFIKGGRGLKMRSGMLPSGEFSPLRFHDQIQTGDIDTFSTDHPHVIRVVHKDDFVEYAFWDEAGLACPGGATYEEAVESFDNYCKYCLRV